MIFSKRNIEQQKNYFKEAFSYYQNVKQGHLYQ